MAEAFAVVVLASRQVLPENLGVEVGLGSDGGRRGGGGVAGASEGERFPAPEREGLRKEKVSAGGDAAELEGDRHGRRCAR